jgi:hypothetical protein
MSLAYDVDRQARAVWTLLALVGAILSVIGWVRWVGL